MAATNEVVAAETGESHDEGMITCKESNDESSKAIEQLRMNIKIRTMIAIFLLIIAISEIAVLHWRISTLLKDKLPKVSKKNHKTKVDKKNYTAIACPAVQSQPTIATKFQKTMILHQFSNVSLFCFANGFPEHIYILVSIKTKIKIPT